MRSYEHWSLLGGWLPVVVAVLAWGALIAGIAWWRKPQWNWIVVAIMAGAAAFGLSRAIDAPERFGSTYPRSFLVWGALPFFALGATLLQWRVVEWGRRAIALTSIPALAAFGAMQINSHYGHVPTLGDLLHAPLPGQVDAARLVIPAGADATAEIAISKTTLREGVVAHLDLPGPVSQFRHRRGWVWVPPAYFANPRLRLPVLMLIAGTPGSPDDWLRAGGALALANRWASNHDGVAPVMVLPDANGSGTADTECVDGPRGRAETYLTVDVRQFMIEHFAVATGPEQWAVAGLSEGGTCALTLVARHPDRFATFISLAGDAAPSLGNPRRTIRSLYGGSTEAWIDHDPATWFDKDASKGVAGFIIMGSHDRGDISSMTSLAERARAAHLPLATELIRGGGHNWYTWKRGLADVFAWLTTRIESTNAPRSENKARPR